NSGDVGNSNGGNSGSNLAVTAAAVAFASAVAFFLNLHPYLSRSLQALFPSALLFGKHCTNRREHGSSGELRQSALAVAFSFSKKGGVGSHMHSPNFKNQNRNEKCQF
ncbi:hypothetical protein PIB30_100866, partial [Stylosanthes scabra]|nr:hypothetical protein [Stylosanthes scabra]